MKAAILGAGAMGKVLAQTIEEQEGISLVAMIEPRNGEKLHDIKETVDVVIDFSNPENLEMLMDFCPQVSGSNSHNRIFSGAAADDH